MALNQNHLGALDALTYNIINTFTQTFLKIWQLLLVGLNFNAHTQIK